jgi:hypothetical protein
MSLGAPEFVLLIFVPIIICAYFLPAILGRKKSNATSIFLVNLLLGWSFIGWVVALVWALSNDNKPPVYYNNTITQPVSQSTDKTDQLFKFKQLLDSGAITQDEFDKEKSGILNS